MHKFWTSLSDSDDQESHLMYTQAHVRMHLTLTQVPGLFCGWSHSDNTVIVKQSIVSNLIEHTDLQGRPIVLQKFF